VVEYQRVFRHVGFFCFLRRRMRGLRLMISEARIRETKDPRKRGRTNEGCDFCYKKRSRRLRCRHGLGWARLPDQAPADRTRPARARPEPSLGRQPGVTRLLAEGVPGTPDSRGSARRISSGRRSLSVAVASGGSMLSETISDCGVACLH
jgi:hypothetical protein